MKYSTILSAFAFVLIASTVALAAETKWGEGKTSKWQGFTRVDFKVDGKACYVVEPKEAAKGNPWIWRARFPGFHAGADIELVKRGFHIAHMNTNGMLGSPAALKHWDAFYDYMTKKGLAKKPALEGVSRGGLFVYRWTSRHPDRVACIYADTPVCDFKSWPLGKGKGIGSAGTWKGLLKQYNMTEAEALAYKGNPVEIEILKPIAAAKVPLLHIVSENDTVVPPTENTYVLQANYKKLGGQMDVISVKAGSARSHGHHFTVTLEHIDQAVKFILKNAVAN